MRYVYEVNGRRYKSANVASTGLVGLGRGLEHVGKYPRQAKVTVYYNPDHPATALLEPGEAVQRTGQWAVGIGGIFLLLGGLALQVYRGKIAVR